MARASGRVGDPRRSSQRDDASFYEGIRLTRRETLWMLCSLPWLSLPGNALSTERPAIVTLHWDWDRDGGDAVDHFEVLITSCSASAHDHEAVVARVAADVRHCEVRLPAYAAAHDFVAQVRAVNGHGVSAMSAPVTGNCYRG